MGSQHQRPCHLKLTAAAPSMIKDHTAGPVLSDWMDNAHRDVSNFHQLSVKLNHDAAPPDTYGLSTSSDYEARTILRDIFESRLPVWH